MTQINSGHFNTFKILLSKGGLFFFTILIFLSPLVNLIKNSDSSNQLYYYLLIFISGFLVIIPLKKDFLIWIIVLTIFITFIFLGFFLKGIGAALVFYVSYRGFRYSSVIILQALFILLIINYVVTLYQLSGVYSIVYSFSNYSNHATPISILDVDSIPASFLPQMRPSGIFPAPTYTSFFCIIMYF